MMKNASSQKQAPVAISRRIYSFIITLVILVLTAFFAPASADAAVIYVDAGASGANTGGSWTDARADLQDASAGSRLGPFTSAITGLDSNTTLPVKAYATNSMGTVYGMDRSFRTARPTVSFTSNGQTTAENIGAVTITMVLSEPSGAPVVISLFTHGSATQGLNADYTITPVSVRFEPGETAQTITIHVYDDLLDEDDETVKVAMLFLASAAPGEITVHTVTILDKAEAPAADAGPDQVVVKGASVELDGSGSRDPDGSPLIFSWSQSGGVPVSLERATTPRPGFIAPEVDFPQELFFQLLVRDADGLTDVDEVRVTILHALPRSISGRVTVSEPDNTLKGLENCTVKAITGGEKEWSAATDENGFYKIKDLPGVADLVLFASPPDNTKEYSSQYYYRKNARGDADRISTMPGEIFGVDFQLEKIPDLKIVGVVLDEIKRGLEGVNVAVYSEKTQCGGAVKTDENGAYTASNLKAADDYVISVHHTGYMSAYYYNNEKSAHEWSEAKNVAPSGEGRILHLERGLTIGGLISREGRPVTDVRVEVEADPESEDHFKASTKTCTRSEGINYQLTVPGP
ncbi:MAG: hypothetical protein GY859_05385, partial [Desulfobacterales bacterium]|nr:hypothetical protein [Desulfobacterales bacterium]